MSFVCNEFHRFWTGLTDREASAVLTAALDPLTGEVLSPAAVRKLACDASIIPIVLGSQSQPLHAGRTRRLATPALPAALWVRDKRCNRVAPCRW